MKLVLAKQTAGRLQRARRKVDAPDLHADGFDRPALALLACRRCPRETFELS